MALLIPKLEPVDVAVFSRLCYDSLEFDALPDDEKTLCCSASEAAERFASGYTGLPCQRDFPDEESEQNGDLRYACQVVAAEMIDNRQMLTQYTGRNPTVMQILNMHSINLL